MDTELLKKAEGGDAEAQRQLGDRYFHGDSGIPRDYAQAVVWYRKSAAMGNAGAQCGLGVCYCTGSGVARNFAEAHYWFRKSAERGDAEGQHNLADNYLRGQGADQDFAEAAKWFLKSAEQGHAGSQFFLGWCYQHGRGAPLNVAEAMVWYRKAAAQDHARAKGALAWLLENESGRKPAGSEAEKAARIPKKLGEDLLKEISRTTPDLAQILLLIEQGADFRGRDWRNWTPLIWAAHGGHKKVAEALIAKGAAKEQKTVIVECIGMLANPKTEILGMLLDSGVPVDQPDDNGDTALMLSAQGGYIDSALVLLQRGAEVNRQNKSGHTPLMKAAVGANARIVRQLLARGAVLDAKDALGNTALDMAHGRPEIIKILETAAGKGLAKEAKGRDFIDNLVAPMANLGRELLQEVEKMSPDMARVRDLISRGATFAEKDEKGRNPLILAAWRGHAEIVRALIKARAPLNERDNLGNTALIFAAWQGHAAAAEALIDAGAPLNEVNNKGYSALVCAASNGRMDVARILVEAGAQLGETELAHAGPDAEKLKELAKEARKSVRKHARVMKRLDVLIGQQDAKTRIGNFMDRLALEQARANFGLPSNRINLHTAFTGGPGTGKTTVARILGEIFREAGLLPKGHVVEISPADICGVRYIGEAAQRMREKVTQAQGGILFIDEAYNFTNYKGSKSDVSAEAIDVLLRTMEDPAQQFMVVIAGYEDEIGDFLSENPGLKSRFQTFIPFAGYSAQELAQIYDKMAQEAHYVLGAGCADLLKDLMPLAPDKYSKTFGNARYVRNLFDETLKSIGGRIAAKDEPSREDVMTIIPADIQSAFNALWTEVRKTNLKIGGVSIDLPPVAASAPPSVAAQKVSAFEELGGLIGLENVKSAVKKTAYEMQFFKTRGSAGLPVSKSARHFVFSGNPGTGKTTIARIFGRILKEIGYLEQGHVIETSARDLIGEYIGHTAPKTAAMVANAMGGILFIDEAYALLGHEGKNADFGQEAVSTLLKLMEDYRDKFVVVVAGYPKEMTDFVEVNPGLKSRFTDFIEFEDYTAEDLQKIYLKMAQDFKYVLSDAAYALLPDIMKEAPGLEENFSNGRFVRNLFEDTVKNLASRVLSGAGGPPPSDIQMDVLTRIEKEDLAEAFEEARRIPGKDKDFGFRLANEKG